MVFLAALSGFTWAGEADPAEILVNSLDMKLVRVEPGSFLMGSPEGGDFDERPVSGLFAALSFNEGRTWPARRLLSPGGPGRELNGGAWTRGFVLDHEHAEPKGYLASVQAPDGVIHLISRALHHRFNLAWLKTPTPPGPPPPKDEDGKK